LFDFDPDRQSARTSPKVFALCQAQQCVEARQRDIYESHRHRTFALAYYMTGNELEAEQILTNTFVRAFSAAEEPEGRDVDVALLKELRQVSALCLDDSQHPPVPAPCQSAECVERNVKRTDLEEAIQYLPPIERLLFLLRDVEGYTPTSIAQLLEIPESSVQRGLFTARLRLRGILAEAQLDGEAKAA
jgi:RNA polymerase sigma-70 factor, ECF subfamily